MSCVAQDANHADRLWRYADALQEVLSATPAGGSETLPMRLAQGRLLSEALCSSEALPPFDNSAMDGFALPLSSEAAAGQEFEIVGEQAAGDEACDLGAAGCGMEIMTGARLPSGLSSVVPVEHTVVLPDSGGRRRIRLLQAVTLGQHVRYRGEDVPADTPVMAAGTLLGTEQRSLAAALGIASCRVARQPRIAVLATGRELVDDPDQPLASGQIRNSNRPYLESRLGEAGGVLAWSETVTDEIDAFLAALDRALDAGADMVVSTGAVSMGRYDFVPDALRQRGADIRFHKCKIRPGKPILFAILPGNRLYFGLPGNPISAAVGFRFFVEPAIRHWLGLPVEQAIRLPLLNELKAKPPLRLHLKGSVELDAQGRLAARILSGQESFRMRPLLDTRAWLVVEDDQPAPGAGDQIAAYSPSHLMRLSL